MWTPPALALRVIVNNRIYIKMRPSCSFFSYFIFEILKLPLFVVPNCLCLRCHVRGVRVRAVRCSATVARRLAARCSSCEPSDSSHLINYLLPRPSHTDAAPLDKGAALINANLRVGARGAFLSVLSPLFLCVCRVCQTAFSPAVRAPPGVARTPAEAARGSVVERSYF